jgi:hypothetical protein
MVVLNLARMGQLHRTSFNYAIDAPSNNYHPCLNYQSNQSIIIS